MRALWLLAPLAVMGCIQAGDLPAEEDAGGSGGSVSEPAACEDPPSEALLDFGYVAVGSRSDAQAGYIELRNGGEEALVGRVDGVTSPFSVEPEEYDIPVGGAQRFAFTFAPEEEGNWDAEARFGASCDAIVLRLVGSAAIPAFHCEPDELDFGDVPIGTSAKAHFTCTNATPLELTLELGPTAGDDATLFELPVETRLRVPAGATAQIPLSFNASAAGERFAYFSVSTETERRNLQVHAMVVDEAPAD